MLTGIGLGIFGALTAVGFGYGFAAVLGFVTLKAAVPILFFQGEFDAAKTAIGMSFEEYMEEFTGGGA